MRKPSKFLLFLSLVFLTACGSKNKIHEGDCILNVSLINIPKEFSMQEENIMEHTAVNITLRNAVSKKEYLFSLDADNKYSEQLLLAPGKYDVISVNGETILFDDIRYSASKTQVEVTEQTPSELFVKITDSAAFNQHWIDVQPMPEIVLADISSGLLQINRSIISVKDLLKQLPLEEQVEAGKTKSLLAEELGIAVTVENRTPNSCLAKDCTLLRADFSKNTVVFPSGVTIGMAPSKVFHSKSGFYKEPDSLGGTIFFGQDMGETKVTYHDTKNNLDITLLVDPTGTYVTNVTYEFGNAQ